MEALREEVRLDAKKSDIRFTMIYPFYVDTGLARDPKYRWKHIRTNSIDKTSFTICILNARLAINVTISDSWIWYAFQLQMSRIKSKN